MQPRIWQSDETMALDDFARRPTHCIVEYGYRGFHAHFVRVAIRNSALRHNLRGLQFQESTVSMERSCIEGNLNGIQFCDSTVQLSDSIITGSYWGLRGE